MLIHAKVQDLMKEIRSWGANPFKRHNDATYPIYKFSTLADFGVKVKDGKMKVLFKFIHY